MINKVCAMAKLDSLVQLAKFRGSMLGTLMGDCLGAPFEGDFYSPGMKLTVQKFFQKLDGPYIQVPYIPYTDDTAMTKQVAKCLIEKPTMDYQYMAKLFTQEYIRHPKRGYGENVIEVFRKLKLSNFDDIFKPAKEQFNGTGSYGNGGAMRIAPVALKYHNNYEDMIDVAEKSIKLTHTHTVGINGALLQCIAVHQSFNMDPKEQFDPVKFTMELIEKMSRFEKADDLLYNGDSTPYKSQLNKILQLLAVRTEDDPIKEEEVIGMLGNTVNALYSVPTAIFCFLQAHSDVFGIESTNPYRRAIQYAVTLGGDCDTIASMAGAITGAYYGDSIINPTLLKHCESAENIRELADNLHASTSVES